MSFHNGWLFFLGNKVNLFSVAGGIKEAEMGFFKNIKLNKLMKKMAEHSIAIQVLEDKQLINDFLELGEVAQDRLIGVSSDPNVDILSRMKAMCVLGFFEDDKAISALEKALQDDNSSIREQAIKAHVIRRNPKSAPTLIALASSNRVIGSYHEFERSEISRALVAMGEDAIPYLCEAFPKPYQHGPADRFHDQEGKKVVAQAIGEIGDRRAVPALIDGLKNHDQRLV